VSQLGHNYHFVQLFMSQSRIFFLM